MAHIVLYQRQAPQHTAIQHFLLGLRTSQMHYLASDLFQFGLTPFDISFAIDTPLG